MDAVQIVLFVLIIGLSIGGYYVVRMIIPKLFNAVQEEWSHKLNQKVPKVNFQVWQESSHVGRSAQQRFIFSLSVAPAAVGAK